MDDATLRERLWLGFARLQSLLGGEAGGGAVIEEDGVVASLVPSAPDSPTLNAAVALDADETLALLPELAGRYADLDVRRWGVWVDGSAGAALERLERAGLRLSSSSPGMGAGIAEIPLDGAAPRRSADLTTVGRVNDLAYGNPDHRLERTLAVMPADVLRAYQKDLDGSPAAVALALHHDDDCGVSFVATVPEARRRGLAREVMQQALADAREHGLTSTTLQATDLGERLYEAMGYRRIADMQLWEHRSS